MKKQAVIVRYDVSELLAAMYQEIDAWAENKAAERRYYAAVDLWYNAHGDDAEEAAAKERDWAYNERVIKDERYSAVADVITVMCKSINVDYKSAYAVAKAFQRRNERDFYRRGTAAEWRMTEQNEENFRRLVAGKKSEYVWD